MKPYISTQLIHHMMLHFLEHSVFKQNVWEPLHIKVIFLREKHIFLILWESDWFLNLWLDELMSFACYYLNLERRNRNTLCFWQEKYLHKELDQKKEKKKKCVWNFAVWKRSKRVSKCKWRCSQVMMHQQQQQLSSAKQTGHSVQT